MAKNERITVEMELVARSVNIDKAALYSIENSINKNAASLGIKLDDKGAKIQLKNLTKEIRGEADKAIEIYKGVFEAAGKSFKFSSTKDPKFLRANTDAGLKMQSSLGDTGYNTSIKVTTSYKNLNSAISQAEKALSLLQREQLSSVRTQENQINVNNKLSNAYIELNKVRNASKGSGSTAEDKSYLKEKQKEIQSIDLRIKDTLITSQDAVRRNIKKTFEEYEKLVRSISRIEVNAGGEKTWSATSENLDNLKIKADALKMSLSSMGKDLDMRIGNKKSTEVVSINKEIDAMKKKSKLEAIEEKRRNDATSALNKYNNALKERNRIELELSAETKRSGEFGVKKKESTEYITALKEEKKLNEDHVRTLEEQVSGTNKAAEASDLKTKADARLNAEMAKVNSKGKAQVGIIEDISHGFKQAIARVINYTVVYRTLWSTIQLGKEALQTIVTLDKSMTNIRMVTEDTKKSTFDLMKSYNELAIKLKSTTANIAESADTFLRQGRSISDTNKLIQASTVMSKIGLMSNSEAADALTSVMNGYRMEVGDTMKVVDAMSQVDVSAATSIKEMSEALQLSASVADGAGVSFEKMLGYISTISEVTRTSASTIGQALKSVFSRMGNVKVGKFVDAESGEALNDVEKTLNKVGIKLRTSETEWRNFGDVLDEVAGRWTDFNETEKNALATAIGGTRQRNQLLVLFDNYGKALEMEKEALNSAGAASKKYEAHMESISAKKEALTAEFEKATFNEFTNSAYKLIMLDIPTYFLKFANATNLLGIGLAVLTAITVKYAVSEAKELAIKLALTAAGINKNNIELAGNATKAAAILLSRGMTQAKTAEVLVSKGVSAALAQEIVAMTAADAAMLKTASSTTIAATATKGFTTALTFLSANPIILVLTGMAAALIGLKGIYDKFNVTLSEQKEIVSTLSGQVSELRGEYEALLGQDAKTDEEERYLKMLEAELVVMEETLEIQKQLEYDKKFVHKLEPVQERYGGGANKMLNFEREDGETIRIDPNLEKLTKLYDDLGNAKSVADRKSIHETIRLEEAALYEAAKSAREYEAANIELNDATVQFLENWRQFDEQRTASTNTINKEVTAMATLKDTMKSLGSELKSTSDIWNEMDEQGELSIETVLDIIENRADLIDSLEYENGVYTINNQAVWNSFEVKKQAAVKEREVEINRIKTLIDTTNQEIRLLESRSKAYISFFGIKSAAEIVADARLSGLKGSVSSLTTEYSKQIKELNIISGMSIPNFNRQLGDAKTATDNLANSQMNLLNAMGKAAIHVIDKEIDGLNELRDAQLAVFEARKDQLDEELRLLEEKYDAEDRALELKKAQEALDKAMSSKNVRLYTEGQGWHHVADPKAVTDAQDKLDELKKKYQREDEKKAIKDKIAALEAEKKAVENNFAAQIKELQKLKDAYSDAMNNIENELMEFPEALDYLKRFESASYSERLSMLNDFIRRYNDAYKNMYEANSNMGGGSGGGTGGSNTKKTGYKWDTKVHSSKKDAESEKASEIKKIENRLKAAKDVATKSWIQRELVEKRQRSVEQVYYYKKGGVGNFGEEGMVDYTGFSKGFKNDTGNNKRAWKDGSKLRPEVIFPESKAAKLWGLVEKLPAYTPNSNSITDNGNSVTVQNMTVNAPNGSTFESILKTAEQRAVTMR